MASSSSRSLPSNEGPTVKEVPSSDGGGPLKKILRRLSSKSPGTVILKSLSSSSAFSPTIRSALSSASSSWDWPGCCFDVNDLSRELLRKTFVECDRRMKLSDFRGLLAVRGITCGGGDGEAVEKLGLPAIWELIRGEDLRSRDLFAGSTAGTGEPRLWGSVLDFSLSGEMAAGERVMRSGRCKMLERLLDLPNDLIGVDEDVPS